MIPLFPLARTKIILFDGIPEFDHAVPNTCHVSPPISGLLTFMIPLQPTYKSTI